MLKKLFQSHIKAFDGEGTGQAVFATTEVIDRDGDWTEPGAFGQQTAKLVGAHDWAAPAIGLAKIREDGKNVIADFAFNLEMESGREWYKSLKFNHENDIPQEFSYGFDITDSGEGERDGKQVRILKSMKVFEVSPVMLGAGIDTGLLNIKSKDKDGLSLVDHGDEAAKNLDEFEEFLERCKALAALRKEDNREVGASTRDRLMLMGKRLQVAEAVIRGVLDPQTVDLTLLQLENELLLTPTAD